ncbi:hypothetical protein SAMN05444397_106312, partial [Flavobacterium aquidurense]
MRNFTFRKLNSVKLFFIVSALLLINSSLFAQICGTPGVDGPAAVSNSVNTYYPAGANITLNAGTTSVVLSGVPATDQYGNNFGTIPISAGDLILIIQMQDATIDYTNTTNYGSGTPNSGPDNSGGTGFSLLGNTGIFEYVIATNNVPLTGGNLTFKGTGTNNGVRNSFYNADASNNRGKRTFQIIRVPQYSNLTLTSNITTPPFNGIAGGVIAFNVSGTFNFAGYTIDGSARGFRGGYSPRAGSGVNNSTTYVGESSLTNISGKGEGIAGTPKYMWDGFNQVVNLVEGLPGGSSGRGAPANAGGGGNDHNTGGGGGGNGGFGGVGGAGWQGGGGDLFSNNLTGGGRPGFRSYLTSTPFPRLIMGGGGGAGDANDASTGVKGGVGGAIILINAGNVLGNGTIYANGGKGAPGTYSGSPDGAGGGGAGGTVLLNVSNNSTANIRIEANGGAGGNTENDNNNEHGPGGGGGGGIISHNLSASVTITSSVLGGLAGKSNAGNGNNHGAQDGKVGYVSSFTVNDIPPNLQVNANCFPSLETKVKTLTTTSVCNSINEKVSYEIKINNTGAGNAAGVVLDFKFPIGMEFDSASATYSADASGPSGALANSAAGTANNPVFGGFNIAKNGVVTITLVGKVAASMTAGPHSSNAQALYLDPTRTATHASRTITAYLDGYGSANKTYEGASQSNVPGANFNGTSTTADDITILALPSIPTTTTTQSSCSTPTGTITVNTPANGTGISYTIRGSNPVTTPVTNSTGVFSGLVPNSYVVTTNAQGCTSLPTSSITINSVTGAPTANGVSICQGGTGTLTVTSTCAGTIEWFTASSGGSAIYTGANFNPVLVANSGLSNTNTAGTKTYYVACSGSSCRAAVDFVIKEIPAITGSTPASRCGEGTVTLGATASGGTINWYAASSGGPSLGTGTTFITPSLSASTSYYVEATNNGCTTLSRTEVRATINIVPTISAIESSRCGAGTLTLNAVASTGATVYWYADSTTTTSLASGESFTTPNLSTTTTYYVGATITSTGCSTASRVAVAAVINNASTIVFTSGTQNPSVCGGAAIPNAVYTFGGSANNATASNLPNGLVANVDLNAKTVTISGTPTASGTYTIATVGHTSPCSEASITGSVTVTPFPGTANNTTSTATICEATTKTLSATPAGGTWSVESGGGTIAGSVYTPADVSVNTSVTIKYTVAANGSCAASSSDVTFTVNPFAGTADNTTNTAAICETATKTLSATPTGGTWSIRSGGGSISGSVYTPANITADTPIRIRYTVAANGSCAASSSDVTFTVNPFAGTASNTTSNAAICETATKTLSATPAGGTWSVESGGGTILGSVYTPADVSVNTPVTIKYTIAGNGSCAASSSDVTFTVNPFAGTASNTTTTTAICETATKTLSATPAGGTWSVVLGGGTILGSV